MATSCEELTHWKRPWCWEGLGAGGEGDDRGGDGWMAWLTQWTWIWVNSRSWWWTGRPGVLRFMGWQRVRHDWATELNWTDCLWAKFFKARDDISTQSPSHLPWPHSSSSFMSFSNGHGLWCQLFSRVQLYDPWTIACQTPLSMEFSRQEYWRGLPFPSPWFVTE